MPRSAYKTLLVSAAAAASPAVLTTAYTALFGALVTGKKVFVRLTPITATGIKGATIDTSAIVA